MIKSMMAANGEVLTFMGGIKRPEVRLDSLEIGSRFRMDNWDGSWTYGTLIDKTAARCVVVLSGGQQQVVFDDNGRARKFISEGRSTVSWPLEIKVEDVTDAEEDWVPNRGMKPRLGESSPYSRGEDPEERGIHMTAKENQAKGLNARYNHAMKEFQKAADAGDAAKMEVQQSRIDAIQEEATKADVTLAETATPEPEVEETSKAVEPKKAKLKANLDAAKGAKATKAKGEAKVKKAKSTHDCICGCKRETMGLYAPGHDARVKGILISVERGKLGLDAIPEGVRPFVKFKGTHGKEGYALVEAPVKIPNRDDVTNSTEKALEALDI